MEWKSEEEKQFKLQYAEAAKTLTPGFVLETIESRLNDLEEFLRSGTISNNQYDEIKNQLIVKRKWINEVDAEIAEAIKEAEVDSEMTAEQVAKDFSAKKVKASLKDIRK